MMRPPTKGPRSLIRTSTERPFPRWVTSTRVPIGSVRWAAVSWYMLKVSPLDVRRPWKGSPYQEACPRSSAPSRTGAGGGATRAVAHPARTSSATGHPVRARISHRTIESMDVRALAIDYDGTIAENGRTPAPAAAALARVRASGRKLVLVTGRILVELREVCPDVDRMFDAVVAENGALLYLPGLGRTHPLGAAPEPALLAACRLGVAVADAVPALRARAQHVTRAPGSLGVIEFVEEYLLRAG